MNTQHLPGWGLLGVARRAQGGVCCCAVLNGSAELSAVCLLWAVAGWRGGGSESGCVFTTVFGITEEAEKKSRYSQREHSHPQTQSQNDRVYSVEWIVRHKIQCVLCSQRIKNS